MQSVNDDDSPSVLRQLTETVTSQLRGEEGALTLCELLGTMVGLFSLVGEDCMDEFIEEKEAKVRGGVSFPGQTE